MWNKERSVYDPNYVYRPWLKWVVMSGILPLIIIAWAILAAKSSSDINKTPSSSSPSLQSVGTTAKSKDSIVYYKVTKVIDGDTIDVDINGKAERLRLIGIDTPETVDPRKTVECFGKEASNKAKSLLENTEVELKQDPTQSERDTYGRLLAYVFLKDGTHFNKLMIEEGYAHEYTYKIPYNYQEEFKRAQSYARANNKGLWSPSTCNGDTASSASGTPKSSTTVKSAEPVKSENNTASNCDPNYTPCIPKVSYDLDCPDIGRQVRVVGTDVHRFDRDGDGYGCESYQ